MSLVAFKCDFNAGVGVGNSEVRIGDQTGGACAVACMSRKKSDVTINGVTVRMDGNPGCWCQMGLQNERDSNIYKT